MARGSEAEGESEVREGGSICAVDNNSDVDDRASHTDASDSEDGSEGSHDDEDADEDDGELDDSGSEAATADSAGVSGAEDGDEEHEEEHEDAPDDGAPSGVEREARETNGEDDELLKALEGPITSFQPILQRFLRMGRRTLSAARICDHISASVAPRSTSSGWLPTLTASWTIRTGSRTGSCACSASVKLPSHANTSRTCSHCFRCSSIAHRSRA